MTKKKTPSTESKAKKAPVAKKKPAAVAKKKSTRQSLGKDEDYRGQGQSRFGQSSAGENTENQIQGCCVQILESRKNRAQTSASPSVNGIGGGREQGA